MKFIVEIDEQNFCKEIKTELFNNGVFPNRIKSAEDVNNLDIAKAFIGDNYGIITSISENNYE